MPERGSESKPEWDTAERQPFRPQSSPKPSSGDIHSKLHTTKSWRWLGPASARDVSIEPQQRRLMVAALALLLLALASLLYHDRDFWFPDAPDSTDASNQQPPAVIVRPTTQQPATIAKAEVPVRKKSRSSAQGNSVPVNTSVPVNHVEADGSDGPVAAITQRTVLPPLEVEVVAGDAHSVVRPGSNSVHVELPSASPAPQGLLPPLPMKPQRRPRALPLSVSKCPATRAVWLPTQ